MSRRTVIDCDICGDPVEIENTAKRGEVAPRVTTIGIDDWRREICKGCYEKHFATIPWKRPMNPYAT